MDYYFYEPLSFGIRSDIKKHCPSLGVDFKSSPWQKIWVEWMMQRIIQPDITTPVVFLEQEWLKKPICLMPESEDLISKLNKIKFEGAVKAINPIAELFAIAIPKNVKFNGQKIQGVFVSYINHERQKDFMANFSKKYSVPAVVNTPDNTGFQLRICYKDPDGAGRIALNLDLWKLEWVLEAENLEQYSELTGLSKSDLFAAELSEKELSTQFEVLRFVVSFMIYVSVNKEAVKESHSVKMNKSEKGARPLMIRKIKSFKSGADEGMPPHLRNLRDEKYYRNEWSSWPPESRWIPVNMEINEVEEE